MSSAPTARAASAAAITAASFAALARASDSVSRSDTSPWVALVATSSGAPHAASRSEASAPPFGFGAPPRAGGGGTTTTTADGFGAAPGRSSRFAGERSVVLRAIAGAGASDVVIARHGPVPSADRVPRSAAAASDERTATVRARACVGAVGGAHETLLSDGFFAGTAPIAAISSRSAADDSSGFGSARSGGGAVGGSYMRGGRKLRCAAGRGAGASAAIAAALSVPSSPARADAGTASESYVGAGRMLSPGRGVRAASNDGRGGSERARHAS